jgi:hypothetical protein
MSADFMRLRQPSKAGHCEISNVIQCRPFRKTCPSPRQEGNTRPCPSGTGRFNNLRALVTLDLADAAVVGLSADRRFATAYNAALQTGTIAIACSGHRVSARSGHHKVTFEAVAIAIGSEAIALADYFETCRRKRNVIDYMTSTLPSFQVVGFAFRKILV